MWARATSCMGSVPEVSEPEPCDACCLPAETLFNHGGDRLCESCRALFWTAQVLFDSEVTDEAEIISTLAFAAHTGRLWNLTDEGRREEFMQEFSRRYRRFELTKVVEGVPLLRLRSVAVTVVRHTDSELPRKIVIEVFSRFAKPDAVAELYERTLNEEGIHCDEHSGGTFSYDFEDAHLRISVGAKRELHPGRVGYYSGYPRGRIYSFPPPNLVRGFYKTLLGSADKRNFAGIAYALGDHGRSWSKTAEKTIPACVAWYAGERYTDKSEDTIKPVERRPRIARILNRHLLSQCGKPELPEDHWRNDDTIWRDAREISQRLMRAEYFLQQAKGLNNTFSEHLLRPTL
jgi:hypothetical protein